MKTHKLIFAVFATMVLGAFVLTGCSNEDTVISDTSNKRGMAVSIIDRIAEDLNADIRIDSSVNESNSIVIRSEEEYRNFIHNHRKDFEIIDDQIVQPSGCADGIYSGSACLSCFTSLSFDVTVTDGCISGISAGLTGFTFGVGYTQGATHFGCNSGRVCGYINYNLFFEGIGTVFTERVCYNISLRC